MKEYRLWLGALVVGALAIAPLGCDNTARGVKEDAKENTAAAKEAGDRAATESREAAQEAKEEAREVGDEIGETEKIAGEAKEAGEKIAAGAKKAGDKIAAGAKEIGAEAHAAKQTLDVKAALMADKSVDASHIDVDTDDETKTVTLKGSVPTAAQKAAAERIAKAKAEGYKVKNMLTVAAKS